MLYSKVLSIYLGTRTYGQANRDPFDKEGCRGGSETGVCVVTATIPVSDIIQTNGILVADLVHGKAISEVSSLDKY